MTQTAIFSPPQAHLKLHAVQSIKSFFSLLQLCEVFGSPFKWASCILGRFGFACAFVRGCGFCTWICKHVPYLLLTDKVSAEDRSPRPRRASPNCRLLSPFSSLKANENTFHTFVKGSLAPPPPHSGLQYHSFALPIFTTFLARC